MRRQSVLASITSAVAFISVALLPAAPAQAATVDANCGFQNGHCIYWGQSYNGSHSNISGDVSNYPVSGSTSFTYKSSGTGQGQRIGNNNGSNRNYELFCRIRIWYNANYAGPNLVLAQYGEPGWERAGSQLGVLLNNIRSSDTEICYGD
ncbi:hypothetical protein Rhe02_56270 [Rhizocola hellebori]|uniref:Peptidase inhibitor family I36 n=1 Tax=Rhizocola hellebori TaxID=1392758 RepID=A0A8J3QBI4_9ACTN|nr:hypothetical protein [Rhizocola hellebori]GIH07560.1 hypothetical protein Rhe02_56270 [Rhizocola hellebori]